MKLTITEIRIKVKLCIKAISNVTSSQFTQCTSKTK